MGRDHVFFVFYFINYHWRIYGVNYKMSFVKFIMKKNFFQVS